MFPAPYVQPEMNWWPIIIALSITGSVLLIVFILLCFAICKRQQRKQEQFRRRDSLQRSLRASKASILASNPSLSHDVVQQKRRRPPLGKPSDSSFMDISGVTLDDTNTDMFDKSRLDFHRPTTPASTLDYSSSKHLDNCSYFDSDLGPRSYPSHSEAAEAYPSRPELPRTVPAYAYLTQADMSGTDSLRSDCPYKKPRPMLTRGHHPMQLENEIAHVVQRPPLNTVYRNEAYDDASVDRSRSDRMSRSSQDERPKPKETAM